jgi:hypothetical protein
MDAMTFSQNKFGCGSAALDLSILKETVQGKD